MTPAMVIDTNVLEHLFNPQFNSDGHVGRFLEKFARQRKKLCLDRIADGENSRILAEYKHRLQFHLRAASEAGQNSQLLRYVLTLAERVYTAVDLADALGKNISGHMDRVKAERSDQVFVYVACRLNSVMVSNNARHVTDLRRQLCKAARREHNNDTDFLSSSEAEARL